MEKQKDRDKSKDVTGHGSNRKKPQEVRLYGGDFIFQSSKTLRFFYADRVER